MAGTRGSAGSGPSAPGGAADGSAAGGSPAERREQIYRRIDETLGTFDGRIRAEQEAILADRNAHGGDSSGSGAGAGAGGGKDATAGGSGSATDKGDKSGKGGKGGKGEDSTKGGSGAGGGKTGGSADGGSADDGSGAMRSDRQGAARATVVGGGGAAPADVPDGRDDDIVARQIREAAMKETDPELRDKLWDEYRKYKKGK